MINKIFSIISSIGLRVLVIALAKRMYFKILRKKFNFNSWHSDSPLESKPYKMQVVRIANSINPMSVMEVGCGLGEILRKIEAPIKFGIDNDPNVIDAAKYLSPKSIKYSSCNLQDIGQLDFPVSTLDILVLVNWTHEVSWDFIRSSLVQISKKYEIKHLLIDLIKQDTEGYPYIHKESNLEDLGVIIQKVNGADNIRKLYLVKFP